MTTTTQPKPLLPPDKPWFIVVVDPKTGRVDQARSGQPTREYAAYAKELDGAVRTLCAKI